METPTLSDGVVELTGFELSDVDDHLAGEDAEQIRRFGFPDRSTTATVRSAIRRWQESWRGDGPTRAFAVRERRARRLVGGVELRLRPDASAAVSYWTLEQHRGRGFATRALSLAVGWAFDALALREIEAEIEPDNRASRRVAEKAGFTLRTGVDREGEFAGERRRLVVYLLRRPG